MGGGSLGRDSRGGRGSGRGGMVLLLRLLLLLLHRLYKIIQAGGGIQQLLVLVLVLIGRRPFLCEFVEQLFGQVTENKGCESSSKCLHQWAKPNLKLAFFAQMGCINSGCGI